MGAAKGKKGADSFQIFQVHYLFSGLKRGLKKNLICALLLVPLLLRNQNVMISKMGNAFFTVNKLCGLFSICIFSKLSYLQNIQTS